MNEECLICGAPLEYLQEEVLMECFFCHKKVRSLTRCVKGHYAIASTRTRGRPSKKEGSTKISL